VLTSDFYLKPIDSMGRAIYTMDVKNSKIYGDFLAQTYYYVSHSTRLLAFAAGLMDRSDETNFRRFIKHISEETAHEVLAEKDLADLGMKPSDFPQRPETRVLWETQYYKIQHEHPLALMGYIIALEAYACTFLPKICALTEESYGGKAMRFNKLHAEEDPDHVSKAMELTLKLPAHIQELVAVNVQQTAMAYSNMVEACMRGEPCAQQNLI